MRGARRGHGPLARCRGAAGPAARRRARRRRRVRAAAAALGLVLLAAPGSAEEGGGAGVAGAGVHVAPAAAAPPAPLPSRLAAASVDDARVVDAIAVGPSVAERLAEIRERIQAAVEYPPLARQQGLEGVARVRFEIAPGGAPRRVEVAGSSGYALLDRAAARSVRSAAPLPRVVGRLEVPVRFDLEDTR